jgi:hypothetical protein
MSSANGSAAVALGGAAQIRGEEASAFFSSQLRASGVRAEASARALLAALAHDASPPELDDLAQRMILSAADLRIAAFAASQQQ